MGAFAFWNKSILRKLFGFVCTPREENDTTLVVESDDIHFFLSEYTDNNAFLSRQHISFEVESLNQVVDNLEALGIADYEIGEVSFFEHKNYKWCEWREPGGIRLECVELIWF